MLRHVAAVRQTVSQSLTCWLITVSYTQVFRWRCCCIEDTFGSEPDKWTDQLTATHLAAACVLTEDRPTHRDQHHGEQGWRVRREWVWVWCGKWCCCLGLWRTPQLFVPVSCSSVNSSRFSSVQPSTVSDSNSLHHPLTTKVMQCDLFINTSQYLPPPPLPWLGAHFTHR